jgi:hypothetical protein
LHKLTPFRMALMHAIEGQVNAGGDGLGLLSQQALARYDGLIAQAAVLEGRSEV